MVRRRGGERGLTTLLFTDIVSSSEVAVELGDRRWRSFQARHHAEVRRQLKRHGGREVDTAGDGFFATFGSPASGARCAFAIVREVRELGLDIRAGLHIGEAELAGEKVGGIAVTTAQRVESAAGPGQVLLTNSLAPWLALIEEAWNRGPVAVHVSSMQGSGVRHVGMLDSQPTQARISGLFDRSFTFRQVDAL